LILAVISLGLLGFLVSWNEKNLIGVTIAIPFLHYGMAFFAYIRSLSTDANMTPGEYVIFFLAYGI
jgi:hypothetical protein